jgi:WD40 repeat protein
VGALLAATLRLSGGPAPESQATLPPEQLHGVLSRARLFPPLRGMPHQIRFSPDGKYLLVQPESGIYVLNRRPLETQTWIYAPDILPARFSEDSKTLVLATRSLVITRWNLADNRKLDERILKAQDGCLGSELSLHGELAACLDPSLVLELYKTDTGERVFAEPAFTDQEKMAAGIEFVPRTEGNAYAEFVPRNEGTAYAEPLGYRGVNTLEDLADRELFGVRFLFSPETRFLVLNRLHRSTVCVDVNARRKISCPGTIKNRWNATICFVTPDQIAVLDPDDPEKSQIAQFPGGRLLTKLPLAARAATATTQSRYLIVRGNDKPDEVRLFDVDSGRALKAQEDALMDITEGTLAVYSRQGEVTLANVTDDKLEARTILPPPWLPTLRVANASSNLEDIVIGTRSDAGLFLTATGNQLAPFRQLTGAWFAGDDELYIAESSGSTTAIKKVNPKGETTTDIWSPTFKSDPRLTVSDTRLAGPALFALEQTSSHPARDKLRALDLKTGRELWVRKWVHHPATLTGVGQFPVATWYDPPIPYPDPQGERVAIGWTAMESGGQALAKRYPALKREMDAAKLPINAAAAVFEVLEAASGKSAGTALVRAGGPASFDSVFSVGDFLICVRDETRVTVYSLSTGEIQARVFGRYVSASEATGLLAAADANHLRLYDLKTGARKAEYLFSEPPVYTHFSEDGKRLLVLTVGQSIFVLDVSLADSRVPQARIFSEN